MRTENPEAADASQIIHAAEVMLARYGANASHEAAIRARELSDEGDPDGARLWHQVEAELIARHSAPLQTPHHPH